MSTATERQVIVVTSPKNAGIAAVLAFFFGPLGLLYVGWVPALIVFCIEVPVGLLTFGIGLLVLHPICAVIGYMSASAYNKKLLAPKP